MHLIFIGLLKNCDENLIRPIAGRDATGNAQRVSLAKLSE